MICDTTFLVDLMRNVPTASRKARELLENKIALYVTAVTVFEIQRGMRRSTEEHKKSVVRVLDGLGLLVLDRESASRAAQIDISLRETGLEIEPEDCMIAGIALEHGDSILTRNVKHFARVPGLRVESY